MRKLFALLFCVILVAALSVYACAASVETLTVVTETSTASTKLSSLPVSKEGMFCGWFTTLDAAKALDTSKAAKDGHVGTVYGTVIPFTSEDLDLVGAEMRTTEPYGLRFLAKIDKALIRTLQKLHAENCKGVNNTLTPRTEHDTGIGYGMVLALDASHSPPITKKTGATVTSGVTVAGVSTFAEDATTITYTATVLGIDSASMASEIAARPYITYADANGNERTVYYTQDGSVNAAYGTSIYDTAELVVNDSSASSAQKTAANSIISSCTNVPATVLTTIDDLNLYSENNSNPGGNAYIELDRSTLVALDGDDHTRYEQAFYPRITKVKEDLYLMTFHYKSTGQHLYYTTSTDGINWKAPTVFYNSAQTKNKVTYTSGPLKEITDDYYYAVNADHCVLDDGTILCVYSRRPCKGYSYQEYCALSTLELRKGTVGSNNTITWSSPVSIYHGQNWEAEILQRSNGTVEIYFTHIAPMIYKYGFQDAIRSSGVGMISSTDRGNTWVPNVTAAPFAAKRVYQTSAGNLTIDGKSVPIMNGQMPGVVELAQGDKMMIVAEAKTVERSSFMIGKGYSNAGCEWTNLGISEVGPSNHNFDVFKGAGPSLMRFDSGEILLTYNTDGILYTRLLNNRGTNMTAAYVSNVFYNSSSTDSGFWSGSAPIGSHSAILAMCYTKYKGVTQADNGTNTTVVGKVRLNHPIDATEKTMTVDGNLKDWKYIDDALFVGSLNASIQATYRFAYDDDYIYVAIDRVDNAIASGDANYVYIADGSGYIKVKTDALPSGVTCKSQSISGGRTDELRIDRKTLGLDGNFIMVCPGFTDAATGIDDRINGTILSDTTTWLKINLK